jgi:hypothetical protein
MDLVIAVGLCNCAIAIFCLAVAFWAMRLRQQVVALKNCCDRWTLDCDLFLHAPASIDESRMQIQALRQLYQQQLITIDRLRSIGLLLGIARTIRLKRR